jgi:RNase P subunit RPR2
MPTDCVSASRFITPSAPNPIQRVICPKCRSPMWLTRIEPYLSDRDMRTFECDGCGQLEMIAVKYRPRNAERSAWLKSCETRISDLPT